MSEAFVPAAAVQSVGGDYVLIYTKSDYNVSSVHIRFDTTLISPDDIDRITIGNTALTYSYSTTLSNAIAQGYTRFFWGNFIVTNGTVKGVRMTNNSNVHAQLSWNIVKNAFWPAEYQYYLDIASSSITITLSLFARY